MKKQSSKTAKPLIASVPKTIKVNLPTFPKPLTGFKKAVADLRRKENPLDKYMCFNLDKWKYSETLLLKRPKQNQLFQATTDAMNGDRPDGIKKGEYFSGTEINMFQWVEHLNNPTHLFVIETEKTSTLTQVLEYDCESGIITCYHWGSYHHNEEISISDVKGLYLVKAHHREMAKQIS